MAVDNVGLNPVPRRKASQGRFRRTRLLLASAISGMSLCAPVLSQQQSATGWQAPPVPQQTASYAAPAIPLHMAQYQLEQPTVSGQVDAVHSPNVDKLLKPQFKLEMERHHSQLIITRKNIRRIAVTDSSIVNYVQYTPTELSVVGLELGKTDLTLWFEGETEPAIYEMTVVRDASLEEQRTIDFGRLERRLTTLFPNSRVYLIPIGNQVIVRGQAYDAEEAQHILQIVRAEVLRSFGRLGDDDDNFGNLNLLAGGAGGAGNNNNLLGNQGFRDIVVNDLQIPGEYNVKMRVVVAEINRSELRNMGLDWNVLFNNARQSISGTLGGTPAILSGVFENGEISVFLNWLATNGSVTLLAEPVLVTMSGHSASILGGGEYAVPTIIGLGGGQTTTFRGFGTSMVVTPTIIDRDLIRLQVIPEFSSLNQDNAVQGIPGTNVKRVQTTVELREGQTLAIGGLISRQTQTTVRRIPLLGDIPWVGSRLFHAKNASEVETELLVLVSPEIVRPMEPDEVPPLPNYYITHPNDHDLYKYGRTEGNPDTSVYQIAPYGTGATYGIPQGYSLFNPPVTHGGFAPGQTPGTIGGGVTQQYGPPPVPQPEGSLPSTGYAPTSPMPSYPSGATPGWQSAPGQSTPSAPIHQYPATLNPPLPNVPATPPATVVPPAAIPGTPLPPIPQNFSTQSQPGPLPGSEQPTMKTRLTSMFRKQEPTTPAPQVRTAAWSRK